MARPARIATRPVAPPRTGTLLVAVLIGLGTLLRTAMPASAHTEPGSAARRRRREPRATRLAP